MIPDDLPRSPTGRLPQWVLDEASGRTVTTQPWRAVDPVPPARRWRQVLRGFVTAAVLTSAVGFAVAYQLSPSLRGAFTGAVTVDATAAMTGGPPAGMEEQDTRIAPAPAPVPDRGGYTFLGDGSGTAATGSPITWSPCRPIHYVVDPESAPVGFQGEVVQALATVAAATGLTFVADGEVTEPASADRAIFQPERYGERWAPVLIRFADERQVAHLAGSVGGVANPITSTDRLSGQRRFVSGAVYLDTQIAELIGPHGVPVYRTVLLHELGHLVGLGHVEDESEVMHPNAATLTSFGPGDLAGLATLGRGACAPGL